MEAVVKSENPKNAPDILNSLLEVVNSPMSAETPGNTPRLRNEALELITEFAKKNNLNAIPELEKLLNKSDSPYKERVAKAILELDPSNKTAGQIVKTGNN